jgi:hypothetical protein
VATLKKIFYRLKFILSAVILGLFISLAAGLFPNESGISIPEIKHYGYPLPWLVTNLNGPTEYAIVNLVVDVVFWTIISLITLILMQGIATKLNTSFNSKKLLLILVLFLPLGVLMDLIHELGHGFWGTLVGGRLTYLQITYFILYPYLAVTSNFQLGAAGIEGLIYGSFAYGLMLLGGSMTTNITSWIIALSLHRTNLSSTPRIMLKVLGLFGILDLPFYVIFPQIGLYHWFILGGGEAEPLIGTRMMGIPDLLLYTIITLSTLGLVFFYFRSTWEKASARIKSLASVHFCGLLALSEELDFTCVRDILARAN